MKIDARIVSERIDLDKVLEEVVKESMEDGGGAVVFFIGFVKKYVDSREVLSLEYSVYEPYASKKLYEIGVEEARRHGLLSVRIYHRIGVLEPGEPTVYIIVSSKSRREAFEGARSILERVKHEVPIFKLEHCVDGDYWVIGDGGRVRRGG